MKTYILLVITMASRDKKRLSYEEAVALQKPPPLNLPFFPLLPFYYILPLGTSFSLSTRGGNSDCSEGRKWSNFCFNWSLLYICLVASYSKYSYEAFQDSVMRNKWNWQVILDNHIDTAFSPVEWGQDTSIFVFIHSDAYNSCVSLSPSQPDLFYCQ